MTHPPTPQPPAAHTRTPHTTPPAHHSASAAAAAKAPNVFTNDGSFLARFQRTKKEEEEKKKSEDALTRKRDFDNRFKKRGKRPLPHASDSSAAIAENLSAKRHKHQFDTPLTDYEKQVKNYAGNGLKDNGMGVRPLVK